MKNAIVRIETKGLFGYYDYSLKHESDIENLSRLLILYGDNGTGKSTILNCIFNIMSVQQRRGHKTVIANTKFQSFSIFFSDGYSLHALREKKENIGSFKIILKYQGKEKISVDYPAVFRRKKYVISTNEEMAEKAKDVVPVNKRATEVNEQKLITFLMERNSNVVLLSDDRKLNSSLGTNFEIADENYEIDDTEWINIKNLRHEKVVSGNQRDLVEISLNNLNRFIQKQSIESSIKGEQDSNIIYRDIIKRIALNNTLIEESKTDEMIFRYMNELEDIGKKSRELSRFGLVKHFDYTEIQDLLYKSQGKIHQIITSVIEPYINSIIARLNALSNLYSMLNDFTENLNEYFKNKIIKYHINTGFEIEFLNGEKIPPSLLSSGEKHLVMLLCNVLLSKKSGNIIIIDEPEISLNIKWQRKLLDTLLLLDKERNTQFIIASHSMEILATHRSNVIQVKEKNGEV